MLISVAMATYNGAKYIEEQIESIANQTIKPDELVISDDSSTDDTVKIIKEFAAKASFKVKLICNKHNLGFSKNFSQALENTTGDIVFLSDQDDVWLLNKIEKCIGYFFKNPNIQVMLHDSKIVDDNLNSIGFNKYNWQPESSNNIKYNIVNNGVFGNCCVVRNKFLNYILPIPDIYCHDEWLGKVAFKFSLIGVISDILILYRRHSNTVSLGTPSKNILYTILSRKINSLLYDINPIYKKYEKEKTYLNFLKNKRMACLPKFLSKNKLEEQITNTEHLCRLFEERIRILSMPYPVRYLNILKNAYTLKYIDFDNSWKRIIEDFISKNN